MNRSHNLKFAQSGVWVALAFFAPLAAKADFVNNGIFAPTPTGQFTTLNGGDTSITGWTVTGNSVDWMGNYWQAPPLGGTSIDVDGSGAGGMQQNVTGLTAGQTYTLSFEFAGNPGDDRFGAIKTMNVSVGSVVNDPFSFNTTGHSNSSMGWTLESFTFTAGSTNTLLFASTDNAGSDAGPVIADVSISAAATPEPAFYGALAVGLSGLVYAVRRRRVA